MDPSLESSVWYGSQTLFKLLFSWLSRGSVQDAHSPEWSGREEDDEFAPQAAEVRLFQSKAKRSQIDSTCLPFGLGAPNVACIDLW